MKTEALQVVPKEQTVERSFFGEFIFQLQQMLKKSEYRTSNGGSVEWLAGMPIEDILRAGLWPVMIKVGKKMDVKLVTESRAQDVFWVTNRLVCAGLILNFKTAKKAAEAFFVRVIFLVKKAIELGYTPGMKISALGWKNLAIGKKANFVSECKRQDKNVSVGTMNSFWQLPVALFFAEMLKTTQEVASEAKELYQKLQAAYSRAQSLHLRVEVTAVAGASYLIDLVTCSTQYERIMSFSGHSELGVKIYNQQLKSNLQSIGSLTDELTRDLELVGALEKVILKSVELPAEVSMGAKSRSGLLVTLMLLEAADVSDDRDYLFMEEVDRAYFGLQRRTTQNIGYGVIKRLEVRGVSFTGLQKQILIREMLDAAEGIVFNREGVLFPKELYNHCVIAEANILVRAEEIEISDREISEYLFEGEVIVTGKMGTKYSSMSTEQLRKFVLEYMIPRVDWENMSLSDLEKLLKHQYVEVEGLIGFIVKRMPKKLVSKAIKLFKRYSGKMSSASLTLLIETGYEDVNFKFIAENSNLVSDEFISKNWAVILLSFCDYVNSLHKKINDEKDKVEDVFCKVCALVDPKESQKELGLPEWQMDLVDIIFCFCYKLESNFKDSKGLAILRKLCGDDLWIRVCMSVQISIRNDMYHRHDNPEAIVYPHVWEDMLKDEIEQLSVRCFFPELKKREIQDFILNNPYYGEKESFYWLHSKLSQKEQDKLWEKYKSHRDKFYEVHPVKTSVFED